MAPAGNGGRARAARRGSVVDARLFAAVLTEPWDPTAAPARTAGPEAVTRGVLPRADGPASRMARRTRPSAPVAVRSGCRPPLKRRCDQADESSADSGRRSRRASAARCSNSSSWVMSRTTAPWRALLLMACAIEFR